MLFVAAFFLWGPLLLFALLWTGRGVGVEGPYATVALLQLSVCACSIGVLIVVVYAATGKPWRRPMSQAWFFWVQVLAIALIGLAVSTFAFDQWQVQRGRGARQDSATPKA